MKVKVIKDCYYDNEYIKAGRIIDLKEEKLPSWATLADGIATAKNKNKTTGIEPCANNIRKPEQNTENQQIADSQEPIANSPEQQSLKIEQSEELSDTQKEQYLDLLINEAMEQNIYLDDADKKSVDEQIAELEKLLKKE
jgi:hypothetical protein